jgi:hypothetical protein
MGGAVCVALGDAQNYTVYGKMYLNEEKSRRRRFNKFY